MVCRDIGNILTSTGRFSKASDFNKSVVVW